MPQAAAKSGPARSGYEAAFDGSVRAHWRQEDAEGTAMQVRDLYPLITTPALFQARDFYMQHFGFTVAFEAAWFVFLIGTPDPDSRGATLAFMHPDHPSNPPGPETFDGRGMIVTIEVADAAAAFARVSAGGAPIVHPLTDEAWGQRRFMTRDPAGILVDVVQQIEPAAGFWDRYAIGG
ncbi:VOC family protein [Leptolyngbya sp. 15MV]|nr:VOC family protein [Leptolyngbya sp. 15MV]